MTNMKRMMIIFLILTLFHICLSLNNTAGDRRVFKIALLIPWNVSYDFSGYTSSSAVSLAIKDLEKESFFKDDISFTFLARDDNCRSKEALGNAADLLINETIDVFIGPPCSAACRSVAELAAVFEVPIISWVATDPEFDDKITYSTLARTLGPFSKMGTFLLEIFHYYSWKRVVIISSTYLLYQDAANAIKKVFTRENMTISYQAQYDQPLTDSYIRTTLTKTKEEGRIILLVSSDEETRRFIMMASEFGMTGGDYVFYTINVLPVDNISIDVDIWKGDDGRDEEARLAFECVFHVTLAVLASDKVVKFREDVAKKMQSEDWKKHSLPGYSDDVISDVTMGDRFSPFLYDSIMLYAQALKATINKGQNVSNGSQVAMNFKNQFFSGISGNVILDSNGDREPDYWILDLDPETGRFEKIAEVVNLRDGKREFHKDLRLPSWPGGKVGHHFAPPDTPPCGFTGEICQGIMAPWILAVIVVLIILFLAGSILVAVCLIRKSKFESGLLVQAWKLNYFDIEMVGSKRDKKPTESTSSNITGSVHSNVTDDEIMGSTSMGSVTKSSACFKSISSLGTFHQQIFSDIGYHKGVLVAVKHIKKEHIQISRSILLEFNQLKDIAHCNLNVFVGACIDPPNICLVWHYCPKGSLQDLVMNDEIKLEMTFKLSFLMDICKGMQYLHKSHLHSHGNLKSSNCLVDARWNVRITDYGLPSFLSGQHFDLNEQDLNRRKLWMAPELLRENSPPACGTQKGDVYSFAIIAFEIIMRSEPYPLDIMTAKDVVNRVRNGESIPFRPFIPESCDASQAVVDLMRSAWDENPDDRPNFVQIRSTLKKQAKGEINIMDNVLNMMERYAYNLEEIVEERTQQLMEEKKKTDRLLYRMLPSTVAEQLKLGRTVKPETYDQATLYFSDIVGFVTMASESSPLQIVEFLNDLYSYFDDIIGKHDVYKVETIGDSYVVVSGVPVRNGQRHTAEIANLSLDLLSSVLSYKIKHRPNQRVQLRIGLHTGPVVAGVVGLTMPRYCLFGDTVNMTSRMESSGKAFHIHMSKQCYIALSETSGYEMTLRGEMNVKGKGIQTTYWLHGKKGYDKPLPEIET